jgi:dihydropyrimidinase
MCSPPLRNEADQEALWAALGRGDLQIVSSDHAPYRLDASGKFSAGANPTFKQIANGMPGLQVRLPLLFDAMVSKGRLGLDKFVEITAAAPARLYGLSPRKGAIAVGADADIAIWSPDRRVTLAAGMMRDLAGYTPYEGREVVGWPDIVLARGRTIVENGTVLAKPGSGKFLPRQAGAPAEPTGRVAAELDPASNFGARLM